MPPVECVPTRRNFFKVGIGMAVGFSALAAVTAVNQRCGKRMDYRAATWLHARDRNADIHAGLHTRAGCT